VELGFQNQLLVVPSYICPRLQGQSDALEERSISVPPRCLPSRFSIMRQIRRWWNPLGTCNVRTIGLWGGTWQILCHGRWIPRPSCRLRRRSEHCRRLSPRLVRSKEEACDNCHWLAFATETRMP
jgi:hypothetical protein